MRHFWLPLFLFACNPNKGNPEDTSENNDTGISDTAVAEVDPDEEGREGQVICASGGSVSSSNYSGSFCFGAVDVSSSPTASSSNYTWHAGPMTKVSP